MSDEQQVLEDPNFEGLELSEDVLNSLFTSNNEDVKTETTEPAKVEGDSKESTEVAETEPQETEQLSEAKEESTDSSLYRIGDNEYTEDELSLALDSLRNRNDWQRSNTQKAQEIADERRYLDGLVGIIDKALESEDLREYLGEDHDLYRAIKDYEMTPEEEQDAIADAEQEVANDRVGQLENKIAMMEAEKNVDLEIKQLINKHPELRSNEDAVTEILNVAVDKGLGLEDAFVFANATANGESAILKALKSVEKAEKLKSQPEVTTTHRGRSEDPIPIGKSYDDIEQIALGGHYNLFKNK